MSPAHLLRQAKHHLESLSPERLKVAADFLAYLEDRDSDEATTELRARIAVGLEQADRGELLDGEEVFREIEKRLETAPSAK